MAIQCLAPGSSGEKLLKRWRKVSRPTGIRSCVSVSIRPRFQPGAPRMARVRPARTQAVRRGGSEGTIRRSELSEAVSAGYRPYINQLPLTPWFVSPLGKLFNLDRAFRVMAAVPAARALYGKLIGQSIELLDRNKGRAFPAGDHASLVHGFFRPLNLKRRHPTRPSSRNEQDLSENSCATVKDVTSIR